MEGSGPGLFDPDDVTAFEATVLERTGRRHDARIDDETVVYDVESGRVSSLNRTGTLLWELLSEPRSLGELGHALVERFGVDRDRARADVCAYAAQLQARGMVRVVTAAPRREPG